MLSIPLLCSFFFFNDTATPEIYTLSLHDALPISESPGPNSRDRPHDVELCIHSAHVPTSGYLAFYRHFAVRDRKSTRLNSSHLGISYAVFCLKKKNNNVKSANSGHLVVCLVTICI